MMILVLITLYFFSLPIISAALINFLEKDYSLQKPETSEPASAVVVLSGMVRAVKTDTSVTYEWTEASDRIFAGIELIKLQKAPTLILTRGKLPWSLGEPEGEYLSFIAQKFGVKKNQILLTPLVENTEAEAKEIRRLLKKNEQKILLVTSAFHMHRAKKVFEKEGFSVVPFPVDFRASVATFTPMSFIPSSGGLADTSLFVKEIIGRSYYAFKYLVFN